MLKILEKKFWFLRRRPESKVDMTYLIVEKKNASKTQLKYYFSDLVVEIA